MAVDDPDVKTYSLDEVAAMVLPPEINDGSRWLTRRVTRGEVSGYRIGRTWRMTRRDVEDLIERHRNSSTRPATERSPQRDFLSS